MINEGMMSSEYDDWNTPECVLERVRRVGPIGLDPCSNPQSTVRAAVEWRLDRGEDALRLDWRHRGLVFCNPPYGDDIVFFMRRMAFFAMHDVEIIALIPHRTDPRWYQDNVDLVSAKCEWNGRLVHPRGVAMTNQTQLWETDGPTGGAASGSAPFPSALLYWGYSPRRFAQVFSDCGRIWR